LTFSALGQNYPFAKDFVNGVIGLKDATQKNGQIKWLPHQNERLKLRGNEKGESNKYSPEDLAGFSADTFTFVSLYNVEAYADNYTEMGKASTVQRRRNATLQLF
jgi:hypothetical protein